MAAAEPQKEQIYVHGYLYKKTRDGRWQKRWFETNGCFLTYYKNKKMTKLLAALNLPQVGEIKMLPPDHEDDIDHVGSLFSVELNDRQYMLKAAKKEDAEMWVEKLKQLKKNPQAQMVDNPVGGSNGGEDISDIKQDASANKGTFTKSNRFGCTCCGHLVAV
eukprot:CAMPEP_0205918870 /NCGR_PEP_ID=MMETSP1325-20131115/10068_1 /ASSEMBLY_ACC=CAM_ASM_000708 /TAXON_ID=236786 /ORGANISM="Florenciella sp., Strain RCC1007" /LENGTH=161 /DNA_ID=CAMNT_0053286435 /DNA_START=120 /DNA_END=608 /DNA_ORIENTATION=+